MAQCNCIVRCPHNRPLAAEGFTSYRARSRYGWIMIGATDREDALKEALRSADGITMADLQVWDGAAYRDVETGP